MALKNFEKLIDTIANDANLRQAYFIPETGEACVIGGLAISCGIDPAAWLLEHGDSWDEDMPDEDRWMSEMNGTFVSVLENYDLNDPDIEEVLDDWRAIFELAKPIMNTYGLSLDQLNILQRMNDFEHDTEVRRKILIAKVTEWHNAEEAA
jgi:hypothetical protein